MNIFDLKLPSPENTTYIKTVYIQQDNVDGLDIMKNVAEMNGLTLEEFSAKFSIGVFADAIEINECKINYPA